MGLAPYGEPCYADLIRENLITVAGDGSFQLDMSYFDYNWPTMTNKKFNILFGGPRTSETGLSAKWTWQPRSKKSLKTLSLSWRGA